MEDDSEGVACGRPDLALEGRQQRQYHVHAERLLVPGKTRIKRTSVTVTPVTVTIAYSDSFWSKKDLHIQGYS